MFTFIILKIANHLSITTAECNSKEAGASEINANIQFFNQKPPLNTELLPLVSPPYRYVNIYIYIYTS
jgi:hypothetical protein